MQKYIECHALQFCGVFEFEILSFCFQVWAAAYSMVLIYVFY